MPEVCQDDNTLVSDGLEGDRDALDILFSRYHGVLYSFAHRMLGNREEAEGCGAKRLPSRFLQTLTTERSRSVSQLADANCDERSYLDSAETKARIASFAEVGQ